jgi:hypothetical protein
VSLGFFGGAGGGDRKFAYKLTIEVEQSRRVTGVDVLVKCYFEDDHEGMLVS